MSTLAMPTTGADVAAGPPVARVGDLHVTFHRGGRDVMALRGVTLDVRPGEILGLVGESGSGKSVLGMSLLGLLPAAARTRGEVDVKGLDMLHAPEAERRRIRREHLGAVFQDPMTSLNPTMQIGRQVGEATGSSVETVRLLEAVGIGDAGRRATAYPHELSGGLRQRVMIAMAVAGGPALVVADEPTTALDVTVQAQVLDVLARLRDEVGCAVLLITHDLGVAAQVADRIAVMYSGRLAEVGPSAAVLNAGAHPYGVGLMRSRLSLHTVRERPLAALPGDVPDPSAPPPGCAFADRCELSGDDCTSAPPPLAEVAVGHASACYRSPAQVAALRPAIDARMDTEGPTSTASTVAPAGTGPAAHEADAPAVIEVKRAVTTFLVRSAPLRPRRRLQALRDVSLRIEPGEAVAVVGESGSGKSTLLRVLAGLQSCDGEVVRAPGAVAQMVFQDAAASLTPWLTVGEIISERLLGSGLGRAERAERVRASLAQVGLPDAAMHAKARQLSGGQCQRVALARAIVVPPAVLLCDEPTSALDVSVAANVLNLIAGLRRELGMALVFVTHDLAVARIVADRIAVMYLGRIVELGDAETVVHRPLHPYTKALVAAIPDVGATAPPILGEPASPLAPPPGCAYHPRCPVAVDTCRDPALDPRLERLPGKGGPAGSGALHLAACIRLGEEF